MWGWGVGGEGEGGGVCATFLSGGRGGVGEKNRKEGYEDFQFG